MSEIRYAHQKEYVKKQAESGFVRVTVWVPPSARKQVIDLAEKCRGEKDDG